MSRPVKIALLCFFTLLLGSCNSNGPVRRISEPAVNIQQLTVGADGGWSLDLRIDNFSSVPMRFDSIRLELSMGGQAAGTLQATPGMSIGPEAADIATVSLVPSPAARIVIADALVRNRGASYHLEGSVQAAAEDRRARDYDIKRDNTLNPVPGLTGVLR